MINQDESVIVVIEPSVDANSAECPICLEEKPLKNWVPTRWYWPFGRHRCCQECRNRYIAELVLEGHIVDLPCFTANCDEKLPSDLVREELQRFQPDLLQTYEEKLLKRYLLTTKDVIWCPGPNCNFAAIYNDIDKCPTLRCPSEGCNTLICPKCRGKGVDCPSPLQLEGVKSCPNCGVQIERIKGCPNMICSVCNQQFCWTCGQLGLNHRHALRWNWPTHPCIRWPLHMVMIVILFLNGFLIGVMAGLMLSPMWIFYAMGEPHPLNIWLRILVTIAMLIGFPIVGVGVAIYEGINALNYHYACGGIEQLLIGPHDSFVPED